jgi:16S rRNA (cytosine967-C5)-methyltransferase
MVEVQRLAAAALGSVLAGRSLDAALAALRRQHPQLAARDRAAIQDLAYGTLRLLSRFEALLEALLDKPLKDARLRPLLLVALYQLEHTRAAPHAVVDHAVRASEALGLTSAKALVNAVLRSFLRRRRGLDVQIQRSEPARYCHPQWWIDKLRDQYPAHYAAALEAANRHPPLTLRVNRRRGDQAAYLELLERHGIKAECWGPSAVLLGKPLPAERIPGLAEGLVSVQDAGAQLAAPFSTRARRPGARPGTCWNSRRWKSPRSTPMPGAWNGCAPIWRAWDSPRASCAAMRASRRSGGTTRRITAYSPTCRAALPASRAGIPT